MSWFKTTRVREQPPRPSRPVNYPSDLFVETEKGDVYYIKGNTKFKVFSERVLESWHTPVVHGSELALSKHIKGAPLGFRNGTLINNFADGKMYLISENKARHITSPDVFEKYGMIEKEILTVSSAEVNLHKEGEPLE